MLKYTVCVSLLVSLLAVAYVRGRRVIRSADNAEKSGCYIVKLHKDTDHEVFERTLQNALDRSDDGKVYARSEGVFKFFTIKLSETALDEVKDFENVEYIEEETMARAAMSTDSWALDRIDQTSSAPDGIYNPGNNRDGQGVDIYIFDTAADDSDIDSDGESEIDDNDWMEANDKGMCSSGAESQEEPDTIRVDELKKVYSEAWWKSKRHSCSHTSHSKCHTTSCKEI